MSPIVDIAVSSPIGSRHTHMVHLTQDFVLSVEPSNLFQLAKAKPLRKCFEKLPTRNTAPGIPLIHVWGTLHHTYIIYIYIYKETPRFDATLRFITVLGGFTNPSCPSETEKSSRSSSRIGLALARIGQSQASI